MSQDKIDLKKNLYVCLFGFCVVVVVVVVVVVWPVSCFFLSFFLFFFVALLPRVQKSRRVWLTPQRILNATCHDEIRKRTPDMNAHNGSQGQNESRRMDAQEKEP